MTRIKNPAQPIARRLPARPRPISLALEYQDMSVINGRTLGGDPYPHPLALVEYVLVSTPHTRTFFSLIGNRTPGTWHYLTLGSGSVGAGLGITIATIERESSTVAP